MQSSRNIRGSQKNSPNFQKENSMLAKIGQSNDRLREQINKQSSADSLVQVAIQDKVSQVKNQAVKLAKQLESEKRKNLQLEAIIKNMKYMREESRKKQANLEDAEENLEVLGKQIVKKEHTLQQLNSKTNNLNSKTKNRKADVDMYRTQRVIDSNIFDALEKQLKQHSINYKKLLIEKIKLERVYDKNLANYNKVKEQILGDTEKVTNPSNKNYEKKSSVTNKQEEYFFINAPEIEHALKFTEVPTIQNKRNKNNNTIGSKRSLFNNANVHPNPFNQANNEKYECKVQKIMMETGLNSAEQILDNLKNIDEKNEELYILSNSENDKISELKQQLANISVKVSNKKVKYYTHENQEDAQGEQGHKKSRAQVAKQNCENLKKNISKLQRSIDEEYENINSLVKCIEFRQIQKICSTGSEKEEFQQIQGLDGLQNFFSLLQVKILPLINKSVTKSKQEQAINANDQSDQISKKIVNYMGLKKLKENENVPDSNYQKSNIDEILNKLKKVEPSEKIMQKQDFKKQYDYMRTNLGNNNGSLTKNVRNTKKTTTLTHKISQ